MSEKTVDRIIVAVIAVSFFLMWEVAARNEWIESLVFPPPSRILMNFGNLWRNGLVENVSLTLMRFFGGLFVGAVPGIALGLVVGWVPRLRRIVDPFIAAIHPIPKIVLFPLFIVIFGINEWAKMASVALTVFFPAFINSAAGAREISPLYFEVVSSYGGRGWALLRHVVLPGSLPMILSGIRIAANLGLLVTVAIELTVTSPGMGSIIWMALQAMRIEDLYGGVLIIALIGITINMTIQGLLKRLTPWQGGRSR